MNAAADIEGRFVYTFGKKTYTLSARTHIMGILNVTPDSFYDGGRFATVEGAVAHALQMVADGADIIDVGGESTRPKGTAYGEGAEAVSAEEEMRRVIPVIESLVRCTDIPVSIDTYKSSVAARALAAGAVLVNDVSGFRMDADMPRVVGDAGASAVVMHMRGTPKTTQRDTHYADLFGEITSFLRQAVEQGERAGIRQILVDPGIGFGKQFEHNLQLISRLSAFASLHRPILVGPSRKSFLGTILDTPVEDRLEGTIAAVVACILAGAHIVRVHDVKACKRAALVADAVRASTASIDHQ